MTLAPMSKRKRNVSLPECHSSIFEPYIVIARNVLFTYS